MCATEGVEEPDLFTEFGSYTVATAGTMIYEVIQQKAQNDKEKWNMVNGSFMTTLPDTGGLNDS